jgi:hypothetical protein
VNIKVKGKKNNTRKVTKNKTNEKKKKMWKEHCNKRKFRRRVKREE